MISSKEKAISSCRPGTVTGICKGNGYLVKMLIINPWYE